MNYEKLVEATRKELLRKLLITEKEADRLAKEIVKKFQKELAPDLSNLDELIDKYLEIYANSLADKLFENLKAAAQGEHHEHSEMYPEFARIAKEEGFYEIASVFEAIAVAEKYHEKRYLALLENIEKNRVFKREATVRWKCGNCGYVHEGTEAPEKCPACAHPRGYFELYVENY